MAGGHVLPGGIAVPALIVEEYIGAKRAQKLAFIHTTEEHRFIDADIPGSQSANDPLMSRRRASGKQRRPDGGIVLRVSRLDSV
jgi:hypothetical protein